MIETVKIRACQNGNSVRNLSGFEGFLTLKCNRCAASVGIPKESIKNYLATYALDCPYCGSGIGYIGRPNSTDFIGGYIMDKDVDDLFTDVRITKFSGRS